MRAELEALRAERADFESSLREAHDTIAMHQEFAEKQGAQLEAARAALAHAYGQLDAIANDVGRS
jgi:hypothetical protein